MIKIKYKTKIFLLLYIYVYFYFPYKNKKIKNYNINNSLKLKIYQIFGNTIGLFIINLSFIINLLVTKGYLIENYKYTNDSTIYGKGIFGIFDHKYAFTLFETTGGSLMQFGATNCLYWCFPKCSNDEDYPVSLKIPKLNLDNLKSDNINLDDPRFSIHKFELFPRNYFGLFFKKIINISNPYFLIEKKINEDKIEYYKVRLITYNKLLDSSTITDVWRILEPSNGKDAQIILSWKLRNYIIRDGYPIGKGVGQGRSLFVAIDKYNYLTEINLNNLNN